MSDKNDNMALWTRVSKTDPKDTKKVTFGRSFTSIDAYSQIKSATKEWGAYGSTWGLKDIVYASPIEIWDNHLISLKAVFYYPDGEFEISNTITFAYITNKGKKNVDDEYTKKIETNTITKALSRLGFNADIFMGRFEDDRYLGQQVAMSNIKKELSEEQQTLKTNVMDKISKANKLDEVLSVYPIIKADLNNDALLLKFATSKLNKLFIGEIIKINTPSKITDLIKAIKLYISNASMAKAQKKISKLDSLPTMNKDSKEFKALIVALRNGDMASIEEAKAMYKIPTVVENAIKKAVTK